MELIWQGEAGDDEETAFRLMMDDDGLISFQCRSGESDEWTDVDDAQPSVKFAV